MLNEYDDVGRKRKYSKNILQWSKNDFKSKKKPMETTKIPENFFSCIKHVAKTQAMHFLG